MHQVGKIPALELAHGMGDATERPSTKLILDPRDENTCANHVEKNAWQVCCFQAVKWLLT